MTVPPLVLRQEKGSPLTTLEMDDNLRILRDFENSVAAQVSIALNPDGTLKNPPLYYALSATGNDSYAFTLSPAPANLAALLGKVILLKADVANTGAATFNPNGLGAIPIRKFFDQPLESNDIKAGQVAILAYDGTNFELLTWPGVVQPINYAIDAGIVNALQVNQSGIISVPSAYAAGYEVNVRVAVTNTGTATLQCGALGAVAIRKNGTEALVAGDLQAGQVATFVHDGTQFQLTTVSKTLVKIYRSAATAFTDAAAVVIPATAHGLGGKPDKTQIFLVNKANNAAGNDYAAGDEITKEGLFVAGSNNWLTLGFDSTNFWLVSNIASGNYVYGNKAGASVGSSAANMVLDWNVKVMLERTL